MFTGTQNQQPTPGTGSLQFRFLTPLIPAQSAAELPEGAANLYFSLHTGNPPSAANLDTAVGPISVDALNDDGTYVLTNVDPVVNTVVIVATTADGLPLAAWQADGIEVIADETVLVDLGDAEPIDFTVAASPDPLRLVRGGDAVQLSLTLNFTNGTTIALPSFDAPEVTIALADEAVANVTTTGSFSANEFNTGNNTTATVTYDLFGVQESDDVKVEVYSFDITTSTRTTGANTTTPLTFSADFDGPDGATGSVGQGDPGVVLSIPTPVEGFSLDGLNLVVGDITSGSVVILVTYTDEETGLVFTDTFEVTIGPV